MVPKKHQIQNSNLLTLGRGAIIGLQEAVDQQKEYQSTRFIIYVYFLSLSSSIQFKLVDKIWSKVTLNSSTVYSLYAWIVYVEDDN